jgi:multiple sugar transport system permease protein
MSTRIASQPGTRDLALTKAQRNTHLRRRAGEWLFNRAGDLLLILLILFALTPIFFMVVASFRSNIEVVNNSFWPRTWQWENYVELWDAVNFGQFYANSISVALGATLPATIFATFAGYALARFRFPGSRIFELSVLTTQLVPGIIIMLPMYLAFVALNRNYGIPVIGTVPGLTFLYTGFYIPLSLWIVRGFFAAIPKDLEEAAMIDGTTRFGAFWLVALPLARPGILATAIYVFLTAWDELFFASVMNVQTIPIGIRTFIGQQSNSFNLMMAASVVVTIPVAIIFFTLQRHMVSGLTAGAVKG